MPTLAGYKFSADQIGGGIMLIAGLLMGITGAICLKHEIGLPEYITCLRSTGWTLAILATLWTSLATWRHHV